MDELVYVDTYGIYTYDPDTSSWTDRGSSCIDTDYNNGIEYDSVHQLMLYGNARHLCSMAADGTITQKNNPPIDLFGQWDSSSKSHISSNPRGGGLIVYNRADSTWRTYNPISDSWGTISHSMPPITYLTVETAIPEYGVIMYVDYNDGSPKIYIYKP